MSTFDLNNPVDFKILDCASWWQVLCLNHPQVPHRNGKESVRGKALHFFDIKNLLELQGTRDAFGRATEAPSFP